MFGEPVPRESIGVLQLIARSYERLRACVCTNEAKERNRPNILVSVLMNDYLATYVCLLPWQQFRDTLINRQKRESTPASRHYLITKKKERIKTFLAFSTICMTQKMKNKTCTRCVCVLRAKPSKCRSGPAAKQWEKS